MEAVWNLEEKWKLSTKQALLLLLFAASGVLGLCLAATKTTFLRRLASRKSTSSQQLIIMEELEEEEKNNNNNNNNKNKNKKKDVDEWAPACGWAAIKTALVGSVRWSRPSRWGEVAATTHGPHAGRETPLPLLEKRATTEPRGLDRDRGRGRDHDRDVGPTGSWPSHNSDSPVWQRPILMGEKCELPRFSGLILYDENGKPCDVSRKEINPCDKEKITAKVVRTTLRDLL